MKRRSRRYRELNGLETKRNGEERQEGCQEEQAPAAEEKRQKEPCIKNGMMPRRRKTGGYKIF